VQVLIIKALLEDEFGQNPTKRCICPQVQILKDLERKQEAGDVGIWFRHDSARTVKQKISSRNNRNRIDPFAAQLLRGMVVLMWSLNPAV
jgi:hypothetical protein